MNTSKTNNQRKKIKTVALTSIVICLLYAFFVVGHSALEPTDSSRGHVGYGITQPHPDSLVLCRDTGSFTTGGGVEGSVYGVSASLAAEVTALLEDCAGNPAPIRGGHTEWHGITESTNTVLWDTVGCAKLSKIPISTVDVNIDMVWQTRRVSSWWPPFYKLVMIEVEVETVEATLPLDCESPERITEN